MEPQHPVFPALPLMVDCALLAFEICPLQHKPGLKGRGKDVSRRNVMSWVLQVTGIWGYLRAVLERTPLCALFPPYVYIPGVWGEVSGGPGQQASTTGTVLEGPPWLPDCPPWVPPVQELSILRSR